MQEGCVLARRLEDVPKHSIDVDVIFPARGAERQFGNFPRDHWQHQAGARTAK